MSADAFPRYSGGYSASIGRHEGKLGHKQREELRSKAQVREAQRVASSSRRCCSLETLLISVIGLVLVVLTWWVFFSAVDEEARAKSRMRGARDLL